jgi:hypothetical protein
MNAIHRMRTVCVTFSAATLLASSIGLVIASHAEFAEPVTRVEAGEVRQQTKDDAAARPTPRPQKYESVVLRGNVVELGPHMLKVLNVPVDADVSKAVVALVTDSGEVHPLVKDVRSRGFWMDKRLRDRPMELHVHKFPGLPFVRVIDTYSFKDGKKFAVDYWCTVCAITTFEPGPCPCCQDEIELRERPVEIVKSGK